LRPDESPLVEIDTFDALLAFLHQAHAPVILSVGPSFLHDGTLVPGPMLEIYDDYRE